MIPRKKEEEAIVLDFLQHGYSHDNRPMHQKTSIAHAIGKANFTLLEPALTTRMLTGLFSVDDALSIRR